MARQGVNLLQLCKPLFVITDHKALISLLNGNNKKNKTLFSRLTRWLDRVIPFDFVIEHKSGAKIELADFLSRHPSKLPTPITQYDSKKYEQYKKYKKISWFQSQISTPC